MPLARVVRYLAERTAVDKLRIEGHVPDAGPKKSQVELSKERAMAVAQWLVGKGVACDRLLPVGFGSARVSKGGERIVLVEAVLDGKARGSAPIDGGAPAVIAGNPCQ